MAYLAGEWHCEIAGPPNCGVMADGCVESPASGRWWEEAGPGRTAEDPITNFLPLPAGRFSGLSISQQRRRSRQSWQLPLNRDKVAVEGDRAQNGSLCGRDLSLGPNPCIVTKNLALGASVGSPALQVFQAKNGLSPVIQKLSLS